ncbi:MAG: hypothetical protein AAF515_18725 [Pseudomonadota bacterium]
MGFFAQRLSKRSSNCLTPCPVRRTNSSALSTLFFACAALCAGACAQAGKPDFQIAFSGDLKPSSQRAAVRLRVTQADDALRVLDLAADEARYSRFEATAGALEREGERLVWRVPATGGELRFSAKINAERGSGFDARITPDWALLRLEDIFPAFRSVARKGVTAATTVTLVGPQDWSFETRYGRVGAAPIAYRAPRRRFDRPTGWLLAGKLGVRRDRITDRSVVVAAPAGTRYPRVPTLAFLRWTLPEFTRAFPSLPDHLLIVSGDDSMWRGALSGPQSVFLHPNRPLISENATSTLLHELVHVATRWRAASGDDWIVEGVAEYFALKLLHASGGISDKRFADAIDSLRGWARRDDGALRHPSKGADTAFAAVLFFELDEELSKRDEADLSAVIADLLEFDEAGRVIPSQIDRQALRQCVRRVLGEPSKVLQRYLD